jgi:hypothetical protein
MAERAPDVIALREENAHRAASAGSSWSGRRESRQTAEGIRPARSATSGAVSRLGPEARCTRADKPYARCRAPAFPRGAKEHEGRAAARDVHRDCAAPTGTNNHIGLASVVLDLRDANRLIEVFIGQSRVQDFVAATLEVRGLHAPGSRGPAVEKEDFHGRSLVWIALSLV